MKTDDLLRATRKVYLLVPKPGSAPEDETFWSMRLEGLHEENIKKSVTSLRQDREKHGVRVSKDKSLKITELQKALATTLGTHSYDHWRETELPRIRRFLTEKGMTQPADLINWSCPPGLAKPLTAHRLAERFFNSGLPLPKRVFTGVGSLLFAPYGYGRPDIQQLAGKRMYGNEEFLDYGERHANEVVLRAHHLWPEGAKVAEYLDLTGRMLLLNALSEYVGCGYNLLGDNLMQPMQEEPVFTLYNASEEDLAFERRLFQIFRAEIERSAEGWVDVIPLPENDNLIFLRGADGRFDWVIRDQREEPFTENPLYPAFHAKELPSAMKISELAAHLYFTQGRWRERLEHEAECRHYVEGGTAANWPGYDQLLLRELVAAHSYAPPRPRTGQICLDFVPHRIHDRCLMISSLITADEFSRFFEKSDWRKSRRELAMGGRSSTQNDLVAVNPDDQGRLPVSVTWFDAIAFCRYYEEQTPPGSFAGSRGVEADLSADRWGGGCSVAGRHRGRWC